MELMGKPSDGFLFSIESDPRPRQNQRCRNTMGRILRKKDPSKKKAKNRTNDSAGSENNTNSVAEVKRKVPVLPKKSAPTAKQERRFFETTVQFLREVKIELKKVTWPSKKQTMGSTVVVIILVIIISLFLGLVDMGLSSLISVVLQ
jgi:preprotein translocase subunit SecE